MGAITLGAGLLLVINVFFIPLGLTPRWASPLTGQVVDAATGVPIAGVIVVRQPIAQCLAFHGGSRRLPVREATTDAAGRFAVGGGVDWAWCLAIEWNDQLHVVAPGYQPRSAPLWRSDGSRLPMPIRLTPARTAREALGAAHAIPRWGLGGHPAPRWEAAIAAARQRATENVEDQQIAPAGSAGSADHP